MGKKRGFFAEIHHQQKVAEARRAKENAAAQRAHAAAHREAERAHKAAVRAHAQFERASEAERKAAEKEALRLHVEDLTAETESLNLDLAQNFADIDSLLQSTLELDDFVDLDSLIQTAIHPPFCWTDGTPASPPLPPPVRPEPSYFPPDEPTGLSARLGGGKKFDRAIAAAQEDFARDHQLWQQEVASAAHVHQTQMADYKEAESRYTAWCAQRERDTAISNQRLDDFAQRLAANEPTAIEEYIGIVLSNSVYPDVFPVEHDFEFDAGLNELSLAVIVPAPVSIPSEKAYKYNKSQDAIVSTQLSRKAQQDLYSSAIHQVALRSIHEIFEADREDRIQTIALRVCAEAPDPATGLPAEIDFVAVAAERTSFMSLDLSNVVPLATLQHLGAQISKNPTDLVAIDTSVGVRTR